jgi:hypothetical protein
MNICKYGAGMERAMSLMEEAFDVRNGKSTWVRLGIRAGRRGSGVHCGVNNELLCEVSRDALLSIPDLLLAVSLVVTIVFPVELQTSGQGPWT